MRKPFIVTVRLLLVVTAMLVLGQVLKGSMAPKWQSAAAAYHRAQRLRTALKAHPNCPMAVYLRVVRAYQLVYRKYPGYRNAPAALAAAAGVYAEAGREFASDRYDSKAIEAYNFLIAQYPRSGVSREALFTIADIYRRDIENPEAARAAYREYLKRYPGSAKAADAGLEIARIDRALTEWRARQALPSRQTAPSQPAAGEASSGALTEVEAVRHWIAPHYTRVVIETGREIKFNSAHLQKPPRLIFDLDNTRLSPDLAQKVFPVENGFLRRIRVAQFAPTVTRVVLDVPQIEDYSVFSLPHPFRLVIDVRGAAPHQAAPHQSARRAGARLESRLVPAPSVNHSRIEMATADADAGASGDAATLVSQESHTASESVANSLPAAETSTTLSPPQGAALGDVAPTLTRALGLKIRRIVIDPGHGGHDTGTIGPGGIEEKNVVLDVALRLRSLIVRKLGCQVVMTRSTDTFIPLEERTAIANQEGADLFVSIHANASHDPRARGIETYYLNFTRDPEALAVAARENATSESSVFQLQSLIKKIALSEKLDESRDFAKVVDRQLTLHLDEDGDRQPDRGIKKAPFVVLIGANMPSILVEISFLSDPHDERLLRSSHFRQEMAWALYDGIARYTESLGTIRVAQRAMAQPLQHDGPSF